MALGCGVPLLPKERCRGDVMDGLSKFEEMELSRPVAARVLLKGNTAAQLFALAVSYDAEGNAGRRDYWWGEFMGHLFPDSVEGVET